MLASLNSAVFFCRNRVLRSKAKKINNHLQLFTELNL